MAKTLNLLNLTDKTASNDNSQIIDDSALIECVNNLNLLREYNSKQADQEQERLYKINRINAEMQWFSQVSAAL